MQIQKIKKRNGQIVDFSQSKICTAITKAFMAVRGNCNPENAQEITNSITAELEKLFTSDTTPSVENIQDLVERRLMQDGCYDVAKAYIIYRYEHAKAREEKRKIVLEKIERNEFFVIKRAGKKKKFSLDKLKKMLSYFVHDYKHIVDVETLALQCQTDLYDGIKTPDVHKALILSARSFIEHDPAYSKIAARLLFNLLYKEVIGYDVIDFNNLDKQYREAFVKNIKTAVEIKRLDPKILDFDLEKLSAALVPERDDMLLYLGAQVLYDRYFLHNPFTKQILETPQAFWMRVAMGLSMLEENKEEWAIKFYNVMSTLRFVPSTPTLFHAGTIHSQLSSCYLNTVQDDLGHIFKCIGDNAQLSKWSGGIGTDWTDLRGTGALIKGTGVESQGVIPFLRIANDTTVAINRSGKRRGATCAYLETWHIDVEDFLELRKNTGDERRRTPDMDTANWIPDLFFKRVKEDADWTLFSPEEVPELHHLYGKKFEEKYAYYENQVKQGKINLSKTLKAKDLWKKMLVMLFETGHPWMTFKDSCNIRSPQTHAGVIHNSNLCTEITLNTSAEETAVCNLGSLNLGRHINNGKMDADLTQDTVTTAIRMLDNVIDVNFYPTVEAKTSNLKHRPIGLGIMGFQDALYMLNISFNSDACVDFASESMELISYHAISASANLAKERGTYESYRGSKWDGGIFPQDTLALLEKERGLKIDVVKTERLDWAYVRRLVVENGMRNSNCLAIAPTATISNISGCFPCIEPVYKNIYVKANFSGDFTIINSYLVEDLKKLNLWDFEMLGKIKYNDGNIQNISGIPQELKDKYKEAFEISPRWLIKIAASRGQWIDQSQSLNLYFTGSSGKDLSDIYMYAWEMGLKTTYYLRTLAVSQVEKSTVSVADFGATHLRNQSAVTPESFVNIPANVMVAEHVMVTDMVNNLTNFTSTEHNDKTDEGNTLKMCKILEPSCEACQ